MKNSKQPISPCTVQQIGEDSFRLTGKKNDLEEYKIPAMGLTKREYFAGLAMQGLLSDCETQIQIKERDPRFKGENFAEVIAMNSVEIADALLKQLEQ